MPPALRGSTSKVRHPVRIIGRSLRPDGNESNRRVDEDLDESGGEGVTSN